MFLHKSRKYIIMQNLETENCKKNTPNTFQSWEPVSGTIRLLLALLAVILWAVIFASWYVTPSPDGYGSHIQLAIPKCSWITEKNRPCPTCGMTTAYSLTIRGRIIQAFITQPAGCVFAVCHIILTLLLTYMVIVGKHPTHMTAMVNYFAYRILFTIVFITLAGWAWTWLRFSRNQF